VRHLSFTQKTIAATSVWFRYRTMKSVGFHFQRSGVNSPSVPTLSAIHWLNTEATSMPSKSVTESVTENSGCQKSLQILSEINQELKF